MEVSSYDSIDKIDRERWNSIVGPNSIYNSYEYLKAIEYSRISGFRFQYFMFYEGDVLVAHIQVGILSFEVDGLTGNTFLKKIFGYIKKVFPNFFRIKLIEAGFCTALGNALLVTDKKYLNEILRLFDGELIRLAKQEKTSFIVVRDFTTREKEDYDYLLSLKYSRFSNLPNALIRLNYRDFDDYLRDLGQVSRKNVNKRIRVFEEAGCTVREICDLKPLSPQLLALWRETYLRAKEAQREILEREYFEYLSSFLGQNVSILLCEKEQKPIGFTMLLDAGDSLKSSYCGIDYDLNRTCYTYFVLYYETIKKAIRMQKKWADLGFTSYNPKIEVGAIPDPLYGYAKSRNPLLNRLFVALLRMSLAPPAFTSRHIYHPRHYARYRSIYQNLCVTIGGNTYRVKEATPEKLAVEGDQEAERGKSEIRISVEDEIVILATAEVVEVGSGNDGKYRIALKILGIANEYLLLWEDLLQCFNGSQLPR